MTTRLVFYENFSEVEPHDVRSILLIRPRSGFNLTRWRDACFAGLVAVTAVARDFFRRQWIAMSESSWKYESGQAARTRLF